jgi:ketosteroid isomerase-like protein
MAESNLQLVQRGFGAAAQGDVEAVTSMLAPDVRWHGAGDEHGGCQNREQARRWMGEAIARGIRVQLLEARDLGNGRVLVLLQRNAPGPGDESGELPAPHGQILTFHDGEIAEMVVYPTAEEALGAAGASDGAAGAG